MRGSRLRAAGWVLLGAAVLVVTAHVLVQAVTAKPTEFEHWVGLANVWALPVCAIGVAVLAWEKATARRADRSQMGLEEAEQELAAVVLDQGRRERARLLGVDGLEDTVANVRFTRGAGRFREVGGAGEGDLSSVLEYYVSLEPGRLVVLGEAGAGKTVLVLELLVRLLEERDRAAGGRGPVPVLVSATSWDTALPFERWLIGELVARFGMGERVAAGLVRDRRVLPVVDGLDEMDAVGEPVRARAAVAGLNGYMQGRERAPVVVTCRRREYRELAAGVDRATHVELVPLTGKESAAYLRAHLRDEAEERVWASVLGELERYPRGLLAGQLATPWRLTLAATVYRQGGNPAELLPGQVGHVLGGADEAAVRGYAERVNAVLLGGYVPARVRLSDGRYGVEQVERWLGGLAAHLDWQARHGRSATDIVLHQWWRAGGLRIVGVGHVAVAAIPAVAAVVWDQSLLIPAGGLLLLAVLAGVSQEPHRLNVRRLRTRHGLRQLTAGLAAGFAAGLVVGLVVGLAFGLVVGLVVGLAGGLAGGLAAGLTAGLTFGLDDPSPQVVNPRDVIRADGLYGLAAGLTAGLTGGLAVGLVGGLAGGLAYGLTHGLAFWLAFGLTAGLTVGLAVGLAGGLAGGLAFGLAYGLAVGLAVWAHMWVRYHVGVAVAGLRGVVPARFGAFLEWGHQAGLLRVAGIAYQFRHRQLQDWFAPHPPPQP